MNPSQPWALTCSSGLGVSDHLFNLLTTPSPGWGSNPADLSKPLTFPRDEDQPSSISTGSQRTSPNFCPGIGVAGPPRSLLLPWSCGQTDLPTLQYISHPVGKSELEDFPNLQLQLPKWVLSPLSSGTHLPSGMGR